MAGKRDIEKAGQRAELDRFLAEVKATPAPRRDAPSGRLLFALDATMSRQPTWDRASEIQAEMFEEAAKTGGLAIQMVYFRGFREFHASPWLYNPQALLSEMTGVACRGGLTQIGRVLDHAIAETRRKKVGVLVYVGDCVEEDADGLCDKAGRLGLLGTRVFIFHEQSEPGAAGAFREIARLTGGAYRAFDLTSAGALRKLLRAAAAYAAGGQAALVAFERREGVEPLKLAGRAG